MDCMNDEQGNEVLFSRDGDLVSFHSHQQKWALDEPAPGWSLVLAVEDKRLTARPVRGSGFVSLRYSCRWQVDYDRVELEDGTSIPVNVRVFWQLEEGLLQGRLELNWLESGRVLHAVVLPDITLPYSRDTWLVVPRESGWLINDAAQAFFLDKDAPGEVEFVYPGTQHMQCFGWKDSDRGLYLDCRDPEGWIKKWRFAAEKAGVFRLQTSHQTPRTLDPAGCFILPYMSSLGGFSGEWYSVARLYRPWALSTEWASRGPEQRQDNFMS